MEQRELYWDASFEIVQELMLRHADVSVDSIGIQELYEMILALPGFVDDPALANDGILNNILREWYEESAEAWN